jgi:hypothetical protein
MKGFERQTWKSKRKKDMEKGEEVVLFSFSPPDDIHRRCGAVATCLYIEENHIVKFALAKRAKRSNLPFLVCEF